MRHLLPYLGMALVIVTLAPAQETKTRWSIWLPAKNATVIDQYGISHDRTDFSYRWRGTTPCSDKDCSIELQLRNNSDRSESVNYIISVEQENGHTVTTKDHRNFGSNEIMNVPVESYGQEVTGVKIE
jgi:hypothetical protein